MFGYGRTLGGGRLTTNQIKYQFLGVPSGVFSLRDVTHKVANNMDYRPTPSNMVGAGTGKSFCFGGPRGGQRSTGLWAECGIINQGLATLRITKSIVVNTNLFTGQDYALDFFAAKQMTPSNLIPAATPNPNQYNTALISPTTYSKKPWTVIFRVHMLSHIPGTLLSMYDYTFGLTYLRVKVNHTGPGALSLDAYTKSANFLSTVNYTVPLNQEVTICVNMSNSDYSIWVDNVQRALVSSSTINYSPSVMTVGHNIVLNVSSWPNPDAVSVLTQSNFFEGLIGLVAVTLGDQSWYGGLGNTKGIWFSEALCDP